MIAAALLAARFLAAGAGTALVTYVIDVAVGTLLLPRSVRPRQKEAKYGASGML
jgi:hypothetical protein